MEGVRGFGFGGGFCGVLFLFSRKEVANTEMRDKSLFLWRNY